MMSCQDHDYLEVACLYHLPVRVTMLSGITVEGRALDYHYNAARQEVLVLKTLEGEASVIAKDIQAMQALMANPHFDVVNFIQTA